MLQRPVLALTGALAVLSSTSAGEQQRPAEVQVGRWRARVPPVTDPPVPQPAVGTAPAGTPTRGPGTIRLAGLNLRRKLVLPVPPATGGTVPSRATVTLRGHDLGDTSMRNALESALASVATFVPKLVAFLVILIVGLIIAKLVAKAVDAVLERVGFDRAVERGGVKKALDRSKYDASDVVSKIVYYTLVLFVLQMAFGVFGPNPISDLLRSVIAFLPKLVVAIIIVIVAAAIAAAVRELIVGALGGLSYGKVLSDVASVFILALGVIAALNQVGVATTVTTPVLVTVLATIGGILVVGVGGGLVRPMQSRWDGWLSTAEREGQNVRQQVQQSSPSASGQPSGATQRMQTIGQDGGVYDQTGAGSTTTTEYGRGV